MDTLKNEANCTVPPRNKQLSLAADLTNMHNTLYAYSRFTYHQFRYSTVHRKHDGSKKHDSNSHLSLFTVIAHLLVNTFNYLLAFKVVNVNGKPVTDSSFRFRTSMYSALLDTLPSRDICEDAEMLQDT